MNHLLDDAIKSILIVDDEPQILRLLSAILEDYGYHSVTAENVASAKEVLQELSVDLVLTDRDMPGESGIDLIRYIKKQHPQTGVVMVTIIDDLEQAKEVLDLGIYGYITKPFTSNQVLITVENALRHHRAELQNLCHTNLLEQEVVKRTETINEQLNFLETLLNTIPASVYYMDANGVYLGCNYAFEEALGRQRQAIIGKTVADIHAPQIAKVLLEKDRQLLRRGGMQRYETTFVSPDGSPRIVITHAATIPNSCGSKDGLVGVRLDITELKSIEQELRLSEEKLRSIMDNLHVGVVMINHQMELKQINRQMNLWFPCLKGESGTWCFKEFVRQQQSLRENVWALEMFEFGATKKLTVTLNTSEGERIFKMLFYPLYDDSQHVTATIGLFEDITDALASEHELRQAQKLEAIGQLAAGIAHEINTPVQYIGDNVRFLDNSFRDMATVHEKIKHLLQVMKQSGYLSDLVQELENIGEAVDLDFLMEEIPSTIAQTLEGVDRVSVILRAMREFSHPGSKEKTHIDINRAIESTITVCRNEWKYVAEVETSLAANLPLLLCLPGELNQVFLNLIINAAHAISDVTDNGNTGKGVINISTQSDNHWMEIHISDTGSGIPDSIQDRIFDPFFTTKKLGKGTGQGLAIARSIVVDKHQGVLRFTTEHGKGTTFIIQLPLH